MYGHVSQTGIEFDGLIDSRSMLQQLQDHLHLRRLKSRNEHLHFAFKTGGDKVLGTPIKISVDISNEYRASFTIPAFLTELRLRYGQQFNAYCVLEENVRQHAWKNVILQLMKI